MSEAGWVAVAGFVATVLAGWIAGRAGVAAALAQSNREAEHRRAELERAELVEAIAGVLAAVDPEIHGRPAYREAVGWIHRAQLVLDLSRPEHQAINHWLNVVGQAAAAHYTTPAEPGPERDATAQALFLAQGELTKAATAITARANLPAMAKPR